MVQVTTFTKEQEIEAQKHLAKELEQLNNVEAALEVIKQWYDDRMGEEWVEQGQAIVELSDTLAVHYEENAENTVIHTVEGWKQHQESLNSRKQYFEKDGKKYMIVGDTTYEML